MRYAVQPKPLLGPCPCSDCGVPLFWARRLTRVEGVVVGSLRWRRYNGRRAQSQIRHEAVHHA